MPGDSYVAAFRGSILEPLLRKEVISKKQVHRSLQVCTLSPNVGIIYVTGRSSVLEAFAMNTMKRQARICLGAFHAMLSAGVLKNPRKGRARCNLDSRPRAASTDESVHAPVVQCAKHLGWPSLDVGLRNCQPSLGARTERGPCAQLMQKPVMWH